MPTMPTVTIPRTDLSISPLCLGTGEFGSGLDRAAAFRLLDRYLDLGGNCIDTAHVYGDWVPNLPRATSERIIGEWLQTNRGTGKREQIVLATKGAHWRMETPHLPRVSPVDIRQDIEESLQYLQTDRIDLYWLHRDDLTQSVAPILQTLHDAQEAGKIRHYAASNWRAVRLLEAEKVAAERGYSGFVADQILFNAAVLARYPYGDNTVGFMDEERFFFHERTQTAVFAFQSQAFGLFQRMANGTLDHMNSGFRGFYRLPETERRLARMQELGQQTGLTITQISLGWLRGQPFPTIPIFSSRNEAQLADTMTALDVVLTPDQVRYITHG